MKSTFVASLVSVMVVVTTLIYAQVGLAQSLPTNPKASSGPEALLTRRQDLTPFQLVNLAYEGRLQAQGIPSYGQLERAYAQHRVNARTLVEAADLAGLISESSAQDEGYRNAVRSQMRSLMPDFSHRFWEHRVGH